MIYCGIDPGQTGAIAFVEGGELLDVVNMPAISGEVVPHMLAQILDYGLADHVTLEDVHAMPKQGVASTFKFGKNFGIAIGVIATTDLPLEFVRPQMWKGEFALNGKDKDAARLKAIELWPKQKEMFKLKKDVGKADAALIAEWARRNR